MILLPRVDKTPKGKITKKAEFGENGYGENMEYELSLEITVDHVEIIYFGEDCTYLSDLEIVEAILLAAQ